MDQKNHIKDLKAETIIIGGGISGLACARHLHDANIPFVLIADRLGGRLALSKRGHYAVTKEVAPPAAKIQPVYHWGLQHLRTGRQLPHRAFCGQ